MARVLLLFAHPALEKSRIHSRLVASLPPLPRLTFQDLYEAYPDFDIDIAREQQLLVDHDVVIMQHPFFWYSTPAILKQWQDLVLEHGWAYGSKGTRLRGKKMLNVITAGGRESAYHHEGHNRHSVRELLYPIEQTFRLCGMDFLPPYIIFGTHWMTPPDIDAVVERYRALLIAIHDDQIDFARIGEADTLNHALEQTGNVR